MARVNRAMSTGDLDHPGCICGREMRLATVEPTLTNASTTVHSFECIGCGHLLKVMHEGSEFSDNPIFAVLLRGNNWPSIEPP
jgi:hypothetical protein